MFKKARDEPVSPAENCVYVENIQIQRSIYKIPKDVIELNKEFLFPLMKGREIEKFKNIYSDFVVPFPSCAAIPIASSAN